MLAREPGDGVSWRRMVALGVPVAVLVFAVGFVVGLEIRRGPDWRLELNEYVARARASGEAIDRKSTRLNSSHYS